MPQIGGKPVPSSPTVGGGGGRNPFLLNVSGTFSTQETTYSTATLSNVTAAATSKTVAASNASRSGLIVYNDSIAVLYLKFGATASTTSFTVKVAPDECFEMKLPIYTGVVDGIWTSATGNARVTEIT